jgi:hypothetical protein
MFLTFAVSIRRRFGYMTHREKLERKRRLMDFIREHHEDMTFKEIAEAFGTPAGTVGFLSRKMGLVRYKNTLAGVAQQGAGR